MKFTIDLMCGWAHPGMTMVKNSPNYPRTWFINAMRRKVMAPDGYVYMAAVRLLGLTLGVTITRECATVITPPSGSSQASSPGGVSPIASPQPQRTVQLPPELLEQIQAHIRKQQSLPQSPSIPGSSPPAKTV